MPVLLLFIQTQVQIMYKSLPQLLAIILLTVQLIDLSGKVLNTYEGQLQEINSSLSDDSGALGKGVYFVRIEVAGQSVTKKFVKL